MSGAGGREVLFEFTRIGNSVKVTAIDPVSGTEASIVGPASVGETILQNNALRKLDYVLGKKDGG